MLKFIRNVTQYERPFSLKGLSFGHKLVQLTHLVPKDIQWLKMHFINGLY